ncbi:NAD(P)/FAD-dependent oxidoreductase [Oceanibacterium hippocampi]|uniref:Hydrogen cyanide synthase subunit HcnC n=1 Tax=Oceanibacterium hippocampi TaxID=745714 RepID=A0A1Y5TX40_9PROT|nr:FAD-binding oxidoreductase [Oceanibacterium hippocampi]SLN70133.1 Hydrogen cyanide synthase subunit HcnC precursor [Oceanibacterium hippocampi]
MGEFDYIVVGGGMAGASAAFFLSFGARVLVLERETQPGYHSTGRSAALYSEAYGNAAIRALTTGGKPFFNAPPDGFTANPILTPRGAMFVGREDQATRLDVIAAEAGTLVPTVRRIDRAETRDLVPVLREDYVGGGVFEPDAMDIDVHALHQGFLRGFRGRDGQLATDAEVMGLDRQDGAWTVTLADGRRFRAPVVVNAAGAWCDRIAALAGIAPVGLVPKRRTAVLFGAPGGADSDRWPLCVDADEEFYFKPDAGKLIGSPADETPMEPCDVQPEELDIAIAVDRIERATTMSIRRIEHRWAGLRSFVADKTPVVGFEAGVDGFFWLAGQGGYGIQTAPSMGRVSAALARGEAVPDDLAALGVSAAALSPARFRGVGKGGS